MSATEVTHGLRVTLSLPSSTYPANALVVTRVTVVNVSPKAIGILPGACVPAIRTEALDPKGRPYPPPVNFYPASCGPYIPPTPLKAGAALTASPLVVLRSGRLQTDLGIASVRGDVEITGKVLVVRLTSGRAEHVSLGSTPGNPKGGFTASICPVPKNAGKLYVTFVEECNQANGTGEDTGTLPEHWNAIKGSTLHTSILGPSCHQSHWHLVGGWIGRPVATLDLSIS